MHLPVCTVLASYQNHLQRYVKSNDHNDLDVLGIFSIEHVVVEFLKAHFRSYLEEQIDLGGRIGTRKSSDDPGLSRKVFAPDLEAEFTDDIAA